MRCYVVKWQDSELAGNWKTWNWNWLGIGVVPDRIGPEWWLLESELARNWFRYRFGYSPAYFAEYVDWMYGKM